MTECNASAITFSSLGRRKVQADFGGGRLTSDAGAMLLREVDRRIGLIDAMASCIPDRRDPAKVRHGVRSMLAQRVFAVAMGYEDGNDHQDLRNDSLLQLVADGDVDSGRPLASPPTLCRLENGVRRAALASLSEVFVEQFIASHDRPPEEIVLDFDATDDPVHGEQEGRFFHGFYDHYGFLANQFRLLLSSAAYVLVEALRRLGLRSTELAKAQAGTIRVKLLKIGARITCSVRRVVLHLASGYPLQQLFRSVAERLRLPAMFPT